MARYRGASHAIVAGVQCRLGMAGANRSDANLPKK